MKHVALLLMIGLTGCSSTGDGGSPGVDQDASRPLPDAFVDIDATPIADASVPDATSWTELAIEEVPFEVPEGSAGSRELLLITSEAEFQTRFGITAPPEIDFASEWALFYSEGARPHPGHLARVLSVESSGDGRLRATTWHRSPGSGCITMQWDPPATALVTLPAQNDTPALEERPVIASFDCTANGEAQDATCDRENLCGPNLICSGLTRFSSGWCRPTWMWQVATETLDMTIPDGDAGGLARTASISGLATVDEDVIVRVELDHPSPSDLSITITNPDSNEVTVWNGESAAGGNLVIHRVPIGFSGDESVNGTWTLKVVDQVAGNTGRLLGWSLEISSRLD